MSFLLTKDKIKYKKWVTCATIIVASVLFMIINKYKYKIISLLCVLSVFVPLSLYSQNRQQQYVTRTFSEPVKTLKVTTNGVFDAPPVIELGGDDRIQVDFDILGENERWISYRIYHLDHQWRKSNISSLEYYDGFENNQLDFSEPSFNTFVKYRHYRLNIPNEDFNLTKSGNYVVEFFDVDEPEEVLATACFSLFEKGADMQIMVSGNTDIDFNRAHQQVTPSITVKDNNITNLSTDMIMVVGQNDRRDTERIINTPSRFSANKAFYEHNRNLIFEAGNNYRRFDISDNKYSSLGVEIIKYIEPLYHAVLFPDMKRGDQHYSYDQHQNGRYIIRSVNAEDNDTEADYFYVLFTLDSAFPIGPPVYLSGEFTNNIFDESTRMEYNSETRRYEKYMLLKQGHYNYIYLVKPDNKPASGVLTEGNFFETQNGYMVKLFYRPPGARYDRLIGVFYN